MEIIQTTDTLNEGRVKMNDNFYELYSAIKTGKLRFSRKSFGFTYTIG